MTLLSVILSALLLSLCTLDADARVVSLDSLPGINGSLSSRWWSGFAESTPSPLNTRMFTHFVLIEAETVSPASAPVLLWQQGGPGASSLYGLFLEMGPYLLNEESVATGSAALPAPVHNPFAWSRRMNVLVFDFPPPVGFSYCEPAGQAGSPTSCGAWNDKLTAEANYRALRQILTVELPQFRRNELFILGESYAGVYSPMLLEQLLDKPWPGLRLGGLGLGDPCQGTAVICGGKPGPYQQGPGAYFDMLFFYGHGQLSMARYNELMAVCGKTMLRNGQYSPQCKQLVQEAEQALGKFYTYNLYDDCSDNVFGNLHKTRVDWGRRVPQAQAHVRRTGFWCPGNAMETYLARADVRKSLNVSVNADFFNADNGNGFHYDVDRDSVLDIYPRALKQGIRVMVYNGDADPAINSFVTQNLFLEEFWKDQGAQVDELWRPWALAANDSYSAGYTQTYKNGFSYVTIRGSGHQVPEFAGKYAQFFVEKFVANERLPQN